eukprot:PhM_4_TR16202/c0_g1_i1/m.42210
MASWTRRTVLKTKSKESSFCVQFSPDDRYVATASFDGMLVGYDVTSGVTKFEFDATPAGENMKLPITSFKFRPMGRDMILLGCSNGNVVHWDPRTQRVASTHKEENNEVYSVDFRRDGNAFATGGRDRHVRVYDETSGQILRTFSKGGDFSVNPAATRIYATRFAPQDENILISGGWEQTLCIWDMRVNTNHGLVGEIFGPYLCGEALDVYGTMVVTGSHRLEKKLELWDLESRKQVREVNWPHQLGDCMLTCAQFSKDGSLIGTGGGGGLGLKNLGMLVETDTNDVLMCFEAEKAVNSVAFAARDPLVAFGDGSGQVHLYEKKARAIPQA